MSRADAELIAARAAIAAAYLDALPHPQLGEIQLREDQRNIVARAERALARDGGCMIAEDVGRGKTFIALAIARQWQAPLIVIPASLRTTWDRAMQRAGVRYPTITHEALSRGARPRDLFDALIVDESHHFRTLKTRRYDALAELSSRAATVLLSATPLQNRASDLAAQLALFVGETAFSLDLSQLAQYAIRSARDGDGVLPVVAPPEWISVEIDDGRVLRALLDLSTPAAPLDGGDGGALVTIGLVRAWASSRAALCARLAARRRLATALEQGVEAGRAPTRREAREWHGGVDAIQLGFASLLMNANPSAASLSAIRAALDRERKTTIHLLAILRETPDPDASRVCALLRLCSEHHSHRILAFSEFASTIEAYYRALRTNAGVGMLTARQARIASGRIGRDELLARFAPVAQHATRSDARDAITLLLATDLLSEGVNLQDASIVIHLDLPWNPARLAQRLGRVRRPGNANTIRSYLLAPPAHAATLLEADARLRRKIATAEDVIGPGLEIMPALSPDAPRAMEIAARRSGARLHNADARGAFTSVLAGWRRLPQSQNRDRCVVAGVLSPREGWLAALRDGTVVAEVESNGPDDVKSPLLLTPYLDGVARIPSTKEIVDANRAIVRWLDARTLARACDVRAHVGPLRRRVLMRLNGGARSVPRHARGHSLVLIARLRQAMYRPLPLGVERMVAAHMETTPNAGNVVQWLESAAQMLPPQRAESAPEPEVVALLLLGSGPLSRA